MSKENKDNDKEKKKKEYEEKKKIIISEGINFVNCPIHDLKYPKGTTCPACEADKKKNES